MKLRGDAHGRSRAGADTAEKVARAQAGGRAGSRDRAAELHKAGDLRRGPGAAWPRPRRSAKHRPRPPAPRPTSPSCTQQDPRREEARGARHATARAAHRAAPWPRATKLLQEGKPDGGEAASSRPSSPWTPPTRAPSTASGARRTRSWPPRTRGHPRGAPAGGAAPLRGRPLRRGAAPADRGRLRPGRNARPRTCWPRRASYVEGIQQQKEQRSRVDLLMAEARALLRASAATRTPRCASAACSSSSPTTRAPRERLRMAVRLTGEEHRRQDLPQHRRPSRASCSRAARARW